MWGGSGSLSSTPDIPEASQPTRSSIKVLELLSQSSSSIPLRSPGSRYQLDPEPSIVWPSPSASSFKFCHILFLKSA